MVPGAAHRPGWPSVHTGQQWAEVCYVPNWAGHSKKSPDYRFLATREPLRQQLTLPGHGGSADDPESLETASGERYKIRGIVTNRTMTATS